MALVCHRMIRNIVNQRKLLNSYDSLNSKLFHNFSSLNSSVSSSHNAQSKKLVYPSGWFIHLNLFN